MAKIPEKCPKCGNTDFETWYEKKKGMQVKGLERHFECNKCGNWTIL